MSDSIRHGIVRTQSLFFIIWSLFGPIDSSLIEFKALFLSGTFLGRIELYWIIKTILVVASVGLLKCPARLSLLALQTASGSLFLYIGLVSDSLWNYNTHILTISILTFISALRSDRDVGSKDLVTALSLIFATIYFQAAISKLVVSGLNWMNSGLSIYVHLLKFNPGFSSLLDGNPILFSLAGWLTVVGELVLGTLFVFPKTRKVAAAISISFHLMLWMIFHISFWHLWIFYPAVYFARKIEYPLRPAH